MASYSSNKGKYNYVSLETRKILIKMVTAEGISIYRSSRVLGIKN